MTLNAITSRSTSDALDLVMTLIDEDDSGHRYHEYEIDEAMGMACRGEDGEAVSEFLQGCAADHR